MNSESPLISVIIPVYNYAVFLPETVGSLLAQTYSNWECIIVDDGSTDNSKEIAQQLCAKDSRVNYFFQQNSGPTVARNYGLKLAKGAFIQFLDADDLLEHQKLEKQMVVFKEYSDCDIVYGGVKYFSSSDPTKFYDNIDLKSGSWMKNLSCSGEIMRLQLLKENIMVISSPLVRRSLFERLGNMNELLRFNEDWELWARFAIGNAKFRFDGSAGTNALIRVHKSYSTDNFGMYMHGLKACLLLNESINGYRYKKILIPKINYHKRILDEQLIQLLRTDKEKAIKWSLNISNFTKIKRYSVYVILFKFFPVWFCYLYSRFVFIIHKLKNVIIYA
ncbi:MAG: glycosyltransferase family 2 protein [Bacteroidetes bacterium]|nr:glycosyltransferase family 2 protein [Bacteroidota bacterium]